MLTILFTPMEGWGHINACLGLARELQTRGHRIVFAVERYFANKLSRFGFEESLISMPSEQSGVDYWAKFVEQRSQYLKLEPIDIVRNFSVPAFTQMFTDMKDRDVLYKDIVDCLNSDIIITNNYICSPTLTNSGIPWIWMFSAAPHLAFNDNRIPPPMSGMYIII